MEYALNIRPLEADTSPLAADLATPAGGTASYLRLTAPKNPTATGIIHTVEVSGNLVTWLSGAGNLVIEEDTPSLLRVRDATPESTTSRRFIRLRVNANP